MNTQCTTSQQSCIYTTEYTFRAAVKKDRETVSERNTWDRKARAVRYLPCPYLRWHLITISWPGLASFSLLCSDPADMNGCGAHLISPLVVTLFSFPFNFPGLVGQPGTASMLGILQFCCSWSCIGGGELEKAQGPTFLQPLPLALLPWNHTSQLPRPQKECFSLRKKE